MTDLAQEASRRAGEISHWLDNHEPADLLDEVRRFARRRPVAFFALAAAAGVVAGRVTRGAVAANTSVDSDTEPPRPERTTATIAAATTAAWKAPGRTAPAAIRAAATTRAMARSRVRLAPRAACRLRGQARYADDRLRRPGSSAPRL